MDPHIHNYIYGDLISAIHTWHMNTSFMMFNKYVVHRHTCSAILSVIWIELRIYRKRNFTNARRK